MEKVGKTVYSLVYPDTEKVLTKLWKSNPLELYRKAYDGRQDNIHIEFKDLWVKWTSQVVSLGQLNHFYPTAGSSEAIRESIAQYSHKKYLGHRIHMFEGDYEGYIEFAKVYGIEVVKHDRNNFNTLMGIQPGERFYITQPSSVDGNVWEKFDEFIAFLEQYTQNVDVLVDLCYVGTVAKDYKINLTSKLIHSVFFSLSKVFGVYYHRVGGVFSKYEMPGLYGNRWFKNVFSITFAIELMKKYAVQELPKKYMKVKNKILKKINEETNSNFKSSDVFVLAHSELDSEMAKEYQRTNNARICLTQLLDEAIREKR